MFFATIAHSRYRFIEVRRLITESRLFKSKDAISSQEDLTLYYYICVYVTFLINKFDKEYIILR